MLIGILSDSHGRADRTRAAVGILVRRGAQRLLHLGDLGGETVIDELIGHNARIVFGNCDDDVRDMTHYAEIVGVAVDHPLGIFDADGKRIAFTHGHLPDLLDRAIEQGADYVLHGHTHQIRDERIGTARIINPGALQRAPRYTAALLDPGADRLEFIEVT